MMIKFIFHHYPIRIPLVNHTFHHCLLRPVEAQDAKPRRPRRPRNSGARTKLTKASGSKAINFSGDLQRGDRLHRRRNRMGKSSTQKKVGKSARHGDFHGSYEDIMGDEWEILINHMNSWCLKIGYSLRFQRPFQKKDSGVRLLFSDKTQWRCTQKSDRETSHLPQCVLSGLPCPMSNRVCKMRTVVMVVSPSLFRLREMPKKPSPSSTKMYVTAVDAPC